MINLMYHKCIHHLFAFIQLSVLTGFFSCLPMGNSFAADYYIDSSAADDGSGSYTSPWNRLAQVNETPLAAGDQIYFKRGSIFHNESLSIINVHGTEDSPIVLQAYGDPDLPLPIIDGTRDVTWAIAGNNIFSAASSIKPEVVLYKGIPKPATTTLALSSIPSKLTSNAILLRIGSYANLWVKSIHANTVSGITHWTFTAGEHVTYRYVENNKEIKSGANLTIQEVISRGPDANTGLSEWGDWHYDNGRVFILAEENPNTSSVVDLTIAGPEETKPNGISIRGSSYVKLQDLMIQKFNGSGIVLGYTSHSTVEGTHVYGCGSAGIKLWSASFNTVQDNTLDFNGVVLYTVPGDVQNTTDNLIQNNRISNCRGPGISLVRDEAFDPGQVSNNVISGNIISNSNSMYYDNAGIYTFYAGPNILKDNVIRNGGSRYLASAGIQLDVKTDQMTITGNTIENNSLGGVVVSGTGHIIKNNILRNNGAALAGRSQVKFFYAGTYASNCIVTSNTMQAEEGYNFIAANQKESTTGHTINNNIYKYGGNESGTPFLWWPSSSSQWMSFKSWQRLTGHDQDSTFESDTSDIFLFLNRWIKPKTADE